MSARTRAPIRTTTTNAESNHSLKHCLLHHRVQAHRRCRRTRLAAGVSLCLLLSSSASIAQKEVDARPNLRSNPSDTIERGRYADRIDILSLGLDYAASGGDGSFFNEYAKLGGTETSLGTYLAPFITG